MARLQAYLNYDGNCEEAFQFYASAFGKPVAYTMRYGEMPGESGPPMPDHIKDKVVNTALYINDQVCIMGSDFVEEFCGGVTLQRGNNTYLLLDVDNAQEIRQLYDALTQGSSQIEMPLGEQFWAELYASFQDRYGIGWMINFEGNKKKA